jgi:hypothetical protein
MSSVAITDPAPSHPIRRYEATHPGTLRATTNNL